MALLYRPCMHSLIQELQKQSGSRYILRMNHVLLHRLTPFRP